MRDKWDAKHSEAIGSGEIAKVLLDNRHLLPSKGMALDLACGRGANALELARCGLSVDAWDISPVAISRLNAEAKRLGLQISATVRDLSLLPPAKASFDVILVSHFLDRSLVKDIRRALRPGGVLLYQTFNQSCTNGPKTKAFHLEEGELLSLFSGMKIRVYREEWALGNLKLGWRGLSMLVAEQSV